MNMLLQKLMVGGSTAALLAAMPLGAALAQGEEGIEQVVVTGSRVTIAGYSQPTPVTVVGIEQLERNAYPAIVDSLSSLPQVVANPSSFSAGQSSVTGGSIGANYVNLRGLGLSRTLVLFDGQRVVISNTSQGGVDTTLLPASVVSRVDLVTGGASAAWGSDAVTGVANFVINKNLTGFKATIQGGNTHDGLYRSAFLESAWGDDFLGGRAHLEFAGSANIRPDTVLVTQENWFRNAFWVSNPAYVAGSGRPQLIVANNIGVANATVGGIINSSPAGVAGPGVTVAPANALRGIQFVGNGIPQIVNYGNVTNGSISNGGSLNMHDSNAYVAPIANASSSYVFFGYGRYKLTDDIQMSLQVNYGYSTGKGASGGALQTGLVIKSDNAFIPASVRATMQAGGITSFTLGTLSINNYNNSIATGENYSAQTKGAIGPVYVTNKRNFFRSVFSLDGKLGDDWSWNAYIQHSGIRLLVYMTGNPINANIQAAEDAVTVTTANRGTSGLPLGSVVCRSTLPGSARPVANTITALDGCIPLNVFGEGVASPAAIAYVTGAAAGIRNFGQESLKQDVMEASMQGVLPWELPAGKVAIAFGAGYRKESVFQRGTFIGNAGAYANSNFINYSPVSYNVMEGFAEIDAPVLKNSFVESVDVSMAGRITSYSTSGLVETWKLGATSQVNDDIKLRVTWSVDIRAPAINELFNPGSFSQSTQRDPKTQLSVLSQTNTTGNANLVPEVAHTVSGGVVLTPTFIEGLSLSADWYSINLTGQIATLNAQTILNECNATQPSLIHPGQNGNPNDPLCAFLVFNGPGGALSQIKLSPINFSSQTTSGLDVQANYTHDFWDGTLDWALTLNLNDELTSYQPGLPPNDVPGINAAQGQVTPGPKWKGVLTATYNTGPYSFTVQGRGFGTYKFSNLANTGNLSNAANANLYDPAHFHVPMVAELGLRANYKWNDNIALFGAIDNVLNTPPPLVPGLSSSTSLGNGSYNTNVSYGSTLGRSYRMGVRFNY